MLCEMGMSKGLVVCSLLVFVFVAGVLATAVLQLVSAATEAGGHGSLECVFNICSVSSLLYDCVSYSVFVTCGTLSCPRTRRNLPDLLALMLLIVTKF
ncbi:unnamed protein product [Danaus chrysippus]|uniref:(African queen) hypothetical protein n=1 Tax=Danaus chrysippus TaxID=151541 RepID=A0A8J2R1I7_9NEOP|nr:unnamed protein product [Danaus chrysippus]